MKNLKSVFVVMALFICSACYTVELEDKRDRESACDDGIDNDGDTLIDEEDPDCADQCIDEDGDGYGRNCPAGGDCNDSNPDIHPGAEDVCGDGLDSDCGGDNDRCEDCANGIDDNADGLIDCEDPDCADDPVCGESGEDECCDGIDNDDDGDVDLADDGCAGIECGGVDHEGNCVDGIDNDDDGDTDCADSDCSGFWRCGPEDCTDDFDNDGDGAIDCADSDCEGHSACGCSDCDGDGYNSVSSGGADCNDFNENVHPGRSENCTNGIDDDCDGAIDGADSECDLCVDSDGDGHCTIASGGDDCNDSNAAVHPGRSENCTNGIDDDCDGNVDMADSECSSSGDLYTFRIIADIGTTDRTDVLVATGTIYPGGIGTVGHYYDASVGLSDDSGHHCRYTDGRTNFTCELQLPWNADFTNVNFFWSFTSDGSFWGCRWDGGIHTDIIYPSLTWRIEYPDGTIRYKDSDHGRNWPNNGCDWWSEYD